MRPETAAFRGLTNTADQLSLSLADLIRADNVILTDRGKIERALGFAAESVLTACDGGYVTQDLQRFLVVDDGDLLDLHDDFTSDVIRSGLSAGNYYFAEVNGEVFYTNGIDRGMVSRGGEARPWGIAEPLPPTLTPAAGILPPGRYLVVCTVTDAWGMESGNSAVAEIVLSATGGIAMSGIEQRAGCTTNVYVMEKLTYQLAQESAPAAMVYVGWAPGRELPFLNTSEPRGVMPAVFQGQMWTVEPFPTAAATAVWWSRDLHYHHFDDASQGIALPGLARLTVATDTALIVATDRAIHAWNGERWSVLAPYGVPPGQHADVHRGQAYFWTHRGLCTGMPFRNLTEDRLSVAPGIAAAGCVIEDRGMRRYAVALQTGGAAYNARSAIALPSPDTVYGTGMGEFAALE